MAMGAVGALGGRGPGPGLAFSKSGGGGRSVLLRRRHQRIRRPKIIFAMSGSNIPPQYLPRPLPTSRWATTSMWPSSSPRTSTWSRFRGGRCGRPYHRPQGGKYDVVMGGTANSPARALSVVFTAATSYQGAPRRPPPGQDDGGTERPQVHHLVSDRGHCRIRARSSSQKPPSKPLQINEAMLGSHPVEPGPTWWSSTSPGPSPRITPQPRSSGASRSRW